MVRVNVWHLRVPAFLIRLLFGVYKLPFMYGIVSRLVPAVARDITGDDLIFCNITLYIFIIGQAEHFSQQTRHTKIVPMDTNLLLLKYDSRTLKNTECLQNQRRSIPLYAKTNALPAASSLDRTHPYHAP